MAGPDQDSGGITFRPEPTVAARRRPSVALLSRTPRRDRSRSARQRPTARPTGGKGYPSTSAGWSRRVCRRPTPPCGLPPTDWGPSTVNPRSTPARRSAPWSRRSSRAPATPTTPSPSRIAARALAGDDLRRRVDLWVEGGVVEPTVRDAVEQVLHTRGSLSTRTGAPSSSSAPVPRWALCEPSCAGAQRSPRSTCRALTSGAASSTRHRPPGRLLVPARPGEEPWSSAPASTSSRRSVARPTVADLPGPIVIGNYVYADGATNVRVSAAVDLLTQRVRGQRPTDDVALAFLATRPTSSPSPGRQSPRRSATMPSAAPPNCCGYRSARSPADASSNATTARARDPASTTPWSPSRARTTFSPSDSSAGVPPRRAPRAPSSPFEVAPPTRTRSVVRTGARCGLRRGSSLRYRGLRAGHVQHADGCPSHARPVDRLTHARPPWQDEAYAAVHGGLWRAAYDRAALLAWRRSWGSVPRADAGRAP